MRLSATLTTIRTNRGPQLMALCCYLPCTSETVCPASPNAIYILLTSQWPSIFQLIQQRNRGFRLYRWNHGIGRAGQTFRPDQPGRQTGECSMKEVQPKRRQDNALTCGPKTPHPPKRDQHLATRTTERAVYSNKT